MARRRMPSHIVLARTKPGKRTGLRPVALSPKGAGSAPARPLAPGQKKKDDFSI